jgi:hypothetical protein
MAVAEVSATSACSVSDTGVPASSTTRAASERASTNALNDVRGIDKPPTWPAASIPGAIAAGSTNVADSTIPDGGIPTDVAERFDDVEDDGYDVTAIAAKRADGAAKRLHERRDLRTRLESAGRLRSAGAHRRSPEPLADGEA